MLSFEPLAQSFLWKPRTLEHHVCIIQNVTVNDYKQLNGWEGNRVNA